jgi:hypothetical protein
MSYNFESGLTLDVAHSKVHIPSRSVHGCRPGLDCQLLSNTLSTYGVTVRETIKALSILQPFLYRQSDQNTFRHYTPRMWPSFRNPILQETCGSIMDTITVGVTSIYKSWLALDNICNRNIQQENWIFINSVSELQCRANIFAHIQTLI